MIKNNFNISPCVALILSSIAFAGCSSVQRQSERVISRANDLSSRPSWLDETRAFTVEDKNVVFLGQASLPASGRLESGYRIAEADAKARICQNVANTMEADFQLAAEGEGGDANQTKYIFTEACKKVTIHGAQPDRRYWEKIEVVENGDSQAKYRVFSTVKIDQSQLKSLIMSAMTGTKVISEEFKRQALAKWDEITGAPANASPEAQVSERMPAAESKR